MPPNGRQTRRAPAIGYSKEGEQPGRPGVGVDAAGAPAIDPSEKYLTAEISHVHKYFDLAISAERRRVDDLAALRKDYDKQISETQREQMKTTSDLVSTQLDKVTTSLSETINKTSDNIVATLATMNARIAEVEKFRYDMGGRAAVSDPAMTQIANDLSQLKLASGRHEGQEAEATRKAIAVTRELGVAHSGNQNVIGVVSAIIAALALFAAVGGWMYTAARTQPVIPLPVYQAPAPPPVASPRGGQLRYRARDLDKSTTYV